MNKIIKLVIIIFGILFVITTSLLVIKQVKIRRIEKSIEITEEMFENIELPAEIKEDDILGTLTIPKILLEKAPIKEGVELDVLSEAVGHFPFTSLLSGNVGLASHNGGEKAPYFENLYKLKKGDEIYYESIYGTMKYIVEISVIIDETDFSYLNETEDDRLTLITCVNNNPQKRLCVQAVQVK